MFWRKRRREIEALRAQVQDLAQAISTLAAAKEPAVTTAVNTIATAAIESRAKEMESLGGFLRVVSEIGTERAARALGRRRAASGKRGRDGKFLPNPRGGKKSTCRLCSNPAITNPTSEEIREHVKHEAGEVQQITYTHEADRVVAHVHEDLIDHGEAGEQIECPDCDPRRNGGGRTLQ